MFRKVLIANRGEIAVRVIRACRDLDISPVAVFSEPDRTSLHVRLADEAYGVGPAPAAESYLAVDRIVAAAAACGAEAIHPGYGFLSENPRLAEACESAGIVLVGPSARTIRLMGDKTSARAAVRARGVPVVHGGYEPATSAEAAAEAAVRIGYPVMLKAAAGGGGKGMRRVDLPERLPEAFAAARAEAAAAFGDPAVYVEKLVVRPRHVEVQVLADRHGNAVHVGERECSLQRRHQKVVEECPSPAVDEELRDRLGATALEVVRACGYENAGTVEFLLDADRSFYFLEMNTRLQVEHPVTELAYGIDLVVEQLRIAAGHPLRFGQRDLRLRGWALECRICAEDPAKQFFPSPGRIAALAEPSGPGVRIDSGVYEGWEVPLHYDPLIAKLVTWGEDRAHAVARMRRALAELRVGGIKTNVGFFLDLIADPEFAAGRLSTAFVDEFLARRPAEPALPAGPVEAAAVAAALEHERLRGATAVDGGPARGRTAWRSAFGPGEPRPLRWRR